MVDFRLCLNTFDGIFCSLRFLPLLFLAQTPKLALSPTPKDVDLTPNGHAPNELLDRRNDRTNEAAEGKNSGRTFRKTGILSIIMQMGTLLSLGISVEISGEREGGGSERTKLKTSSTPHDGDARDACVLRFGTP
ncbi:cathepsin (ISS) [Anopheles sinensis]|uniref:Cathepsin (ISS) n=1 Tax=Anopheles sinensis TaxID=74873 RepID=A0A084VXU4_ANOSI|nr:cathepsin (ISS) [Anopheles sinensis]